MRRTILGFTCVFVGCGAHHDSLVRVDPLAPGGICMNGGVLIESGTDTNGNGQLDDSEITSTQDVCSGTTQVTCTGGTILSGTITVHTDADWAQLNGVTCIDGDLLIAGVSDDQLPALSSLTTVTGGVLVVGNPNLTSLAGLDQISAIGGTYLVQSNAGLTSLDGLGALMQAAQISIVGNDALTDLTGLESVTDLDSTLLVQDNAQLVSLVGLDNLETSAREVLFRSNQSLASVDALGHARSLYFLEISGSPLLPTVSMPSLTRVEERLLINSNAGLGSIALPVLTTVGDLIQIDDDGALTSLSTPTLLTAGGVNINNDNALIDVSAPQLVLSTANLTLATLPKLTTLELGSVNSVATTLQISGAPLLADFSGLANIQSVGGDLDVLNNSGIQDFSGLGSLQFVSGSMVVTGNSTLSSFVGLTQFTEIGGALTITGNPLLPPATSHAFASSLTIHGLVTIN